MCTSVKIITEKTYVKYLFACFEQAFSSDTGFFQQLAYLIRFANKAKTLAMIHLSNKAVTREAFCWIGHYRASTFLLKLHGSLPAGSTI